jgi:hypothetical protein
MLASFTPWPWLPRGRVHVPLLEQGHASGDGAEPANAMFWHCAPFLGYCVRDGVAESSPRTCPILRRNSRCGGVAVTVTGCEAVHVVTFGHQHGLVRAEAIPNARTRILNGVRRASSAPAVTLTHGRPRGPQTVALLVGAVPDSQILVWDTLPAHPSFVAMGAGARRRTGTCPSRRGWFPRGACGTRASRATLRGFAGLRPPDQLLYRTRRSAFNLNPACSCA